MGTPGLADTEHLATLVLGFLESKSFFGAERALRVELALAIEACEKDEHALKVPRARAASSARDRPCPPPSIEA